MIASARIAMIFCLLFLAYSMSSSLYADDHLDMEYAEHKPLVTDSMLLDITRAGHTLVAVGERGHVITSTDAVNWTQAEIVPTRSTLTTVFSVGGRLWAGGHDAVILTSGDQGKTWTRQFYDEDRQQAVMDIVFFDAQNGIATGSYGLFLRTRNGGRDWEDGLVDPEADYHLNDLLDLGDDRLLIAGEAGYSYRSFDGGDTWEPLDIPYPGSMWGALKSSGECVLFYGLRGHVMESCDFGTSWKELETGSEASISGAAKHDSMVIMAANSGTILTRDDSDRFQVYYHSSGVDFSAAISLGDGNFLLVGEEGVHRFPEPSEEDSSDE
jgi:photosystem II stability/assembly factor-like uncharacterized protein